MSEHKKFCDRCGNAITVCTRCFNALDPPTVTVPREEWERMRMIERAWTLIRDEALLTKKMPWRNRIEDLVYEQIARLDSLTPSNAVEPQPTQ